MTARARLMLLILSAFSASCAAAMRSPAERADGPILEAELPANPPTSAQTATAAFNIRVNQDASGQPQNETAVAVNPTNPLNIVAAARDRRNGIERNGFYASLDGGLTWQDGVLTEGTYTYQSDPAVAACADGSFVYASLSFNSNGIGGIFVYRSTDGGVTWPQKSTVISGTTLDKEWIECDPNASSPYANRVYVGYRPGSTNGPMQLKYSSDGGQTWSAPVNISDGTYDRNGIVLAAGPAGQVYAAWYDFTARRVMFDRSLDGGATFGTDVAAVTGVSTIPLLSHLSRPNSLPVITVDRSGGAYNGTIYLIWTGYSSGDCDIRLKRSTDGGVTWGLAVRIHDDALANAADQFFPAVSVDAVGRLIVTFSDTRRAPRTDNCELWGAISRDGGGSFDTNFLIADTKSNPVDGTFLGDYAGVAATADRIVPVWADARAVTGELDLYTDRFPNMFRYDEVDTLTFSDQQTASFVTQDARFGHDIDYDVVSGLLSELKADAGFAHATCLVNDLATPPLVDSREPPPGDGYWYLIRADGPNGVGTFGDGQPAARPNVRDPLDETIATCS